MGEILGRPHRLGSKTQKQYLEFTNKAIDNFKADKTYLQNSIPIQLVQP